MLKLFPVLKEGVLLQVSSFLFIAHSFSASFLKNEISKDEIIVRKELLDDSNEAKDLTDKVKSELRELLQSENRDNLNKNFKLPQEFNSLKELATSIKAILLKLRDVMRKKFIEIEDKNLEKEEWCCSEK